MTPLENKPSVLIVAAEASSALYATRLLEHWKQEEIDVQFFGIGSQNMVDLGFEAVGRSESLAVVGIQEVLKHYSEIKSVFDQLVELARQRKPKFVLLLDYPDFNLRLAKKLKSSGIPIIYYISPQVWAWRTSRVNKIRSCVDKMLVLFPFEKEFYKQHNVEVEFVGHPLLDEIGERFFNRTEIERSRQRYGVDPYDNLVGLMPGSRWSELKHHLDTQVQVAEKLYQKNPNIKFALLVAPTFSMDDLKNLMPDTDVPIIFIKDDPMAMASMCDEVLCASGTATLLLGLLEKPMVIMYKMNPLTAWLAKRFVKNTRFFGLINILLGKAVVPEFFQEEANPELLAETLNQYIESDELRRVTAENLSEAKNLLGEKGATLRVAKILQTYLNP